jgi:HAD superfamily hydrolase (TIGR01509 family)
LIFLSIKGNLDINIFKIVKKNTYMYKTIKFYLSKRNNFLWCHYTKRYLSIKHYVLSIFIISGLYCTTTIPHPKVVVFDLGGVLFENSISTSFIVRHIGIKKLLFYMLNPYIPKKSLKKQMFAFLEKIKPRSAEQQTSMYIPMDEHQNLLPLLMEEWLAGSLAGHEIISFIEKVIQNDCSLFNSYIEKEIMLKIISLIFDAHLFIKTQKLHPDAIATVQLLKNNGFQVYALSNWDTKSFEILKEKHEMLFSLFDGIMISGAQGITKPSPSFYKAFLDAYQLQPEACIFVDDQHINVVSAKKAGMRAFVCPYKKSIYTRNRANLLLVSKTIQKMIEKIEQAENVLLAQA